MHELRPLPATSVIRDQRVVTETWLHLNDDAPLPERGNITVSTARLARDADALLAHDGELGLRLRGDQDPSDAAIALEHPEKFALIVIEITSFVDGRYFSLARLLRQRFGFEGYQVEAKR